MLRRMEKRDFRSLGRDAQEALRTRAVYLVLTLGRTQAEAAETVGTLRRGAGIDPPPPGQGSGRVNGAALSDALGFYATEAFVAGHHALGSGDPTLAGTGISEDCPPGEAREGSYILGRRDRDQQSGPDCANPLFLFRRAPW